MKIKIFDFSDKQEDIFYRFIYPVYPKEFLFGNSFEGYLFLVTCNFILNDFQIEQMRQHWEIKEQILKVEDTKPVVKYRIQDREAGIIIEDGLTLQEAITKVGEYEQSDKKNNIYTPNFYEIKKQTP